MRATVLCPKPPVLQQKAVSPPKPAPVRQEDDGLDLGDVAATRRGLDLGRAPAGHDFSRVRVHDGGNLPVHLRRGVESLSGLALGDVTVHYGSSKPAQFQALAYTFGSEIHLAAGQERHLPHEAWHVVQQRQRRVAPTTMAEGLPMNADARLEGEADVMGARAASLGPTATMRLPLPAPSGPPGVLQAQKEAEPLSPEAQEMRDKILELSKPQNKQGRKLPVKDIVKMFEIAKIEISRIEIFNWIQFGKRNPYSQSGGGASGAAALLEPVRNNKVVDDWNAKLEAAGASKVAAGDVTTTGDGAQIPGLSDRPIGGAGAQANVKRDPMHEKAMKAQKQYAQVDRLKLQTNALFSDNPRDLDRVADLRQRGAFVDNTGSTPIPLGATYVLAKVATDAKGKTTRQFVGSGVLIDKTIDVAAGDEGAKDEEQWSTMGMDGLNAVTQTLLSNVRFMTRKYRKGDKTFVGQPAGVQVIGWFVPEAMPQIGESSGIKPGDLKDAYEQTNEVTRPLMDMDKQREEGVKFAMLGHQWMGADWHASEDFGFVLVDAPDVDKEGNQRYKEVKGKRVKDKAGNDIPLTKKVRKRVPKAKGSAKAQELANKIYSGNPDKLRNPDEGPGSPFTTCLATATKIVQEYGVDPNVFGGLMAPVFQLPDQKVKPRDAAIFHYLKETGAWVWGEVGFVPIPGDIFLTGTYTDTINVKEKTHGSWTFQHVAIVANIMPNDDQTYTILSQDGGKGSSAAGEDKTGYTIRNYNPKTRLMSGASPKMVIGVWRPAVLKAALDNMPPEIKSTIKSLSPGAKAPPKKYAKPKP